MVENRSWMVISDLHRLEFFELDTERYDRRGRQVEFVFNAWPNDTLHKKLCLEFVRLMTSLTNSAYTFMSVEEYEHTEVNECWIDVRRSGASFICVVIRHKYWGPAQCAMFRDMLKAFKHRYNFEIIDDSNY